MHVILLERVEKLGTIGDVVNVKPGFATRSSRMTCMCVAPHFTR